MPVHNSLSLSFISQLRSASECYCPSKQAVDELCIFMSVNQIIIANNNHLNMKESHSNSQGNMSPQPQTFHRSTFIHVCLSYFFSASQVIDIQLGRHYNHSLQQCLDHFQQLNISINQQNKQSHHSTLSYTLSTLSLMFTKTSHVYQLDPKCLIQLSLPQNIKIIIYTLHRLLALMEKTDELHLQHQMILKNLLNIIYSIVFYLQQPNQTKKSIQLYSIYEDLDMDDLLIKMVTLSLEKHYIPIRKLVMLYTKVLANIFYHGTPASSNKSFFNLNNPNNTNICQAIHPFYIYSDEYVSKMALNNTLNENYLSTLKTTNPPSNEFSPRLTKNYPAVEVFYRKYNMGDCPLAQSIVVGLLRALLTICNNQIHRKFDTLKGSGADSFREWQLSYQYILQNPNLLQHLSQQTQKEVEEYRKFNQKPQIKNEENGQLNRIYKYFYSMKIITTSSIITFFTFLLISLKFNTQIQFSYLLQLISDANGILVFLKFLTDKFSHIHQIQLHGFFFYNKTHNLTFSHQVKLTIYGILTLLYTSCNNYPQKIKNYLFQYNSYLIIKKIPTLFFQSDNQLQDSLIGMPSRQDLLPKQTNQLQKTKQKQQDNKFTSLTGLTELCYDLLKIQIPYFSKKMKENNNNLKMIIEMYCRFPKQVKPLTKTTFQKLMLRYRTKNQRNSSSKILTNIQQLKMMHNQYNNLYYWSNDFVDLQKEAYNSQQNIKNEHKHQQLSQKTNNQWLQENVWKYYD